MKKTNKNINLKIMKKLVKILTVIAMVFAICVSCCKNSTYENYQKINLIQDNIEYVVNYTTFESDVEQWRLMIKEDNTRINQWNFRSKDDLIIFTQIMVGLELEDGSRMIFKDYEKDYFKNTTTYKYIGTGEFYYSLTFFKYISDMK